MESIDTVTTTLCTITVELSSLNELIVSANYINPNLLSKTLKEKHTEDYAYADILSAVIRECIVKFNVLNEDLVQLLKSL